MSRGSHETPTLLFPVDPGWLFIVAGLALCAMGVLIPAQRDLFDLQNQLDHLRQREQIGNERLRQTAHVLSELDDADASLTRRLAALHLNVAPAGDVPVVLAAHTSANPTEWIEARIGDGGSTPLAKREWPDSPLSRLATGPKRLWLLGGGVFAVFVGLMLGADHRRGLGSSPTRVAVTRNILVESKETPMPIAIALAEATDSVTLDVDAAYENEVACEITTASAFAIESDDDEFREAFCSEVLCGAD